MATIRERYYKNMSLEHIKVLNPFAWEDYLKDGEKLTEKRKNQIEDLFDGQDTVSADRIKEVNKKLGPNFGNYAAFRAIVNGVAKHDGHGGIIGTDKTKDSVRNSSSNMEEEYKKGYLPTKEDCDRAVKELYDEDERAITTAKVLNRIEKNVYSQRIRLKSNWRMITEANMKIWSC